jgi:acetyl-CoA carboxylase biotin carboxyl carrier protein
MLNPDDLKKFHDLMVSQDLLELEVKDGDFHLRLSRGKPAPMMVSVPAGVNYQSSPDTKEPSAPAAPAEEPNPLHSIASPLAGIFYRSPSPTSPPFVKEGDKVAFGDLLCIVEAMKVMNEIRADRPCVVKKILVENGKPVSAGQNIFLTEPSV